MTLTPEIRRRWEARAWALETAARGLRVPFHVLASEALEVVRFCQRHWDAERDRDGRVVRPGLESAVREGTFDANVATELLELREVLLAAQKRYRLLVSTPEAAPMERARFVLSELRAALRWCFDDGVRDERDAQLARLIASHDEVFSQDAIAAALFDFAALAERHRAALAGLGGFDGGLVEEAAWLARALREHSAGPASTEPRLAEQQALELRNRVGALLYQRMQQVRHAARFVFRGHPELIREVTSAYAREQRAAHRARS